MISAHRSPGLRISRAVAMAAIAALAILAFSYRWPGDSTLEGEILTVWPPELWAGAFAVMGSLVALGDRRGGVVVFIAIFAFLLVTSEWTTLFRWRRVDPEVSTVGGDRFRLVTWNVARSPDLRSLEPLQPDVCLFQESAPVVGNPTTSAYWKDFHWAATLDPAVFSRYPFDSIEMGPVGPWAPPQAILLHLPSRARVLVVNVRLVLPGVVLKLASPSDAIDLRAQHRDRVAQFERLSAAVEAARRGLGGIEAVVCGDFNTPALAASVRALKPLTDIWPRAGRGWGGTMGVELPVARIDQCWVSEGVHPLRAWVERGLGSDHRFLVVDLAVR